MRIPQRCRSPLSEWRPNRIEVFFEGGAFFNLSDLRSELASFCYMMSHALGLAIQQGRAGDGFMSVRKKERWLTLAVTRADLGISESIAPVAA